MLAWGLTHGGTEPAPGWVLTGLVMMSLLHFGAAPHLDPVGSVAPSLGPLEGEEGWLPLTGIFLKTICLFERQLQREGETRRHTHRYPPAAGALRVTAVPSAAAFARRAVGARLALRVTGCLFTWRHACCFLLPQVYAEPSNGLSAVLALPSLLAVQGFFLKVE